MTSAEAAALVVRAELRPPLKHHGTWFHYIQSAGCAPQMARWDGWRWHIWWPVLDRWVTCEPTEIAHFAYRGPAELAPAEVAPLAPPPSRLDHILLQRCADLTAERNVLAQKLRDAEGLAQHWQAEVARLDPGRFASPQKPAFPANALKYSA